MEYENLVRTQDGVTMREFFEMSMEDRLAYFETSPDFHLDQLQDYHLIGLTHTTEGGQLAFGRDRVNLVQYAEAELGLLYLIEVEACPGVVLASEDEDTIRHTLGFKYFEGVKTSKAIYMNHEYRDARAVFEGQYPKVEFEQEYINLLAMKDLF